MTNELLERWNFHVLSCTLCEPWWIRHEGAPCAKGAVIYEELEKHLDSAMPAEEVL